MRITLSELELHRVAASESFEPGTLDYHGAEFRQTTPLRFDFSAELIGSEIRIRGHLDTRLETSCDRCLEPVQIPVNNNFDLFYRPLQSLPGEEEVEVPKAELEVGFYSGDGIETADVATEQVLLAVPMKVVCRPECSGLCPVCGVNRNTAQCNCTPPQADSPFASLKEG